jgi:hypothetical protein
MSDLAQQRAEIEKKIEAAEAKWVNASELVAG